VACPAKGVRGSRWNSCISLKEVWCTCEGKPDGCRESEMTIVPVKPGNDVRGRGRTLSSPIKEISAFAQEKKEQMLLECYWELDPNKAADRY